MIYLFEDRKDRMESYLKGNLDSDFVKQVIIDCRKSELEEYLSSNFSDASAIIFHQSYSFIDIDITHEDVKNYFIEKKIPFIYFSGGLNNSLVIENAIVNGNINSGDMYKNIYTFLEYYKENKEVNVPLLVNGTAYLLNSLLELQNIITLYLFDKRNDEDLSTNDLYEIIEFVEARLKERELNDDKTRLLEWLKDKASKDLPVKKQRLLLSIQRMNDKILN
ncbi:hypothetical protein ASG22_06840 [Chryseobacterium sp. Leaf405]|uniref:hypothetical protein n=1 Tax=Chryseobacterium sp. Leaf405 TaxID=1736367 RepID=UPI0006F8FD11|nr:hypothetical protein [Chryseobacterium sp. Leaf405]KQT23749.1 hypothetical protein ASG22_06840 [Chryseobacterium sp. Leaf405]